MQTHIYYTSEKLEKGQIVPLSIKNKDGKREIKTCKVLRQQKDGAQGDCMMYVMKVIG